MAMVVKPAEKLGKGAAGAQTKKNVETVEMVCSIVITYKNSVACIIHQCHE